MSVNKAIVLLKYLCDFWESNQARSYRKNTYISFYGGEPLLNIDFIKNIVEWIEKVDILSCKFVFTMTTNAVFYIRECLELEEHKEILILNEPSSNLLLVIKDNNKKYIVKKYNSVLSFKIELFILQPISKLNVPQVIYWEEQSKSGWNWIIYEYIEGYSLYSQKSNLSRESLLNIFYEVGKFLRSFHQFLILDVSYKFNECEKDIINRIELNYTLVTRKKETTWVKWAILFLRDSYSLLQQKEDYVLIIKDLTDKHLLIRQLEEKSYLSGVIDFEMVSLSNKFCGFVLLYVSYFLVDKNLEYAFLDGYGILLGNREKKLIAFFILQYALELCGLLNEICENNERLGEKIIKQVFLWLNRNNLCKNRCL